MTPEERTLLAQQLFTEGYNCSQSVVAAWADTYGLDRDMALRISSSFGGGIGRMRLTCGAMCGLAMLAGLETGSTEGRDAAAKAANYKVVQQLAEEFRRRFGDIQCSALLHLDKPEGTHIPAERNAQYYRKRPCKELVAGASEIFAQFMASRKEADA